MVGILVVTHGSLGRSIIESLELIIGKQAGVIALGLDHGDNVDDLRDEVKESIKKLDKGEGVLVFVDLFGGSPSNVALINMQELGFKSITGLNMPMLLEAFTSRESCNAEELAHRCSAAGKTGIRELHTELNKFL